ncbi:uncharacterized protein LOC134774445 [Penaeus indicus]|uniref:uncharacterized protein LOC134774445 n=1 Tax=Penaeus indicus TaxID=29960 RepID=UPI00300CBD18
MSVSVSHEQLAPDPRPTDGANSIKKARRTKEDGAVALFSNTWPCRVDPRVYKIPLVYGEEEMKLNKWFMCQEVDVDVARSRNIRCGLIKNYLAGERTDVELLEVAIDLCIKVQEIHQKHVIHNDLKEDNVLVDAQGKVHVIDFGNATEEGLLFSVLLSTPARDAYSVGYLLKIMAKGMESSRDMKRIAMRFLEEKPKTRQTLDAGLALLKAL